LFYHTNELILNRLNASNNIHESTIMSSNESTYFSLSNDVFHYPVRSLAAELFRMQYKMISTSQVSCSLSLSSNMVLGWWAHLTCYLDFSTPLTLTGLTLTDSSLGRIPHTLPTFDLQGLLARPNSLQPSQL
jgi:hypothetical protein